MGRREIPASKRSANYPSMILAGFHVFGACRKRACAHANRFSVVFQRGRYIVEEGHAKFHLGALETIGQTLEGRRSSDGLKRGRIHILISRADIDCRTLAGKSAV